VPQREVFWLLMKLYASDQPLGAAGPGLLLDGSDGTVGQFSQPFQRAARLPRKRQNGPEMPASREFDFVSGLPVRRT
jgi:hypothetical protein